MAKEKQSALFKRMESDISSYLSSSIELSSEVKFSQYKLINRIYKFRNRDLTGNKINSDLSYNYYYDIIAPRVDSEVKNLRFDTKHILVFSINPRLDFAAVFLANASLKDWMAENGEDDKLKAAVEEFVTNGNVGFKKVRGGYEMVDHLNAYITNTRAETIDDTDIIERHEMTASQLRGMSEWENVDDVIEHLGNKSFTATTQTTPIESTGKRYEIFEFTGEVSEKEFNEANGDSGGDDSKYFLAKVIVAGLKKNGTGKKYTLFAERLDGKMSDHYIYAHRGKYEGRFWRVGMYELLFDHQIRANEIGNQLARGLDWASKVVFRSKDSRVLQNIRADIDNGDVVITEDLMQVDVRMRGLDQLIADWNRLMEDADRLSNSFEVVRGEALPSGTPFRLGLLTDQNAGKLFIMLRQKLTLPYKRVFRQWVMPELLKDMKGKDIFRLVGDIEILDQFREILVESWYVKNLVAIGPHTKDIAIAIKEEKLDELKKIDPTIKNAKEIWEGVLPRLHITITGENSDIADNVQDLINLVQIEQDPDRIAWILDTLYKIRGIPVPPKREEAPAEAQLNSRNPQNAQREGQAQAQAQQGEQPVTQ
jgi:hypothetical protein